MSLRIKFLTLLVGIPSLCLGLFLYFAISTFVNDKKISLLENQVNLLNSANLFFLNTDGLENLKDSVEKLKKQEGFESFVVVTTTGKIWPEQNEDVSSTFGTEAYQKLLGQTSSEGSFEVKDKQNNGILFTFLRVNLKGIDPLIFVMTSPVSLADRASLLFLFKALSAFIALMCIAVLMSIIFSNRLTKNIKLLSVAMADFGNGNFISQLPDDTSDDEVATMVQRFQAMRKQIQNLIFEKEEKTKIETEMNLAGSLQKSFFPEPYFKSPDVEFSGFFQPANHAGGDWWYYFLSEEKFIFLIGDVTGHGLNSAMLTGVARSAMSLISSSFVSPVDVLQKLNRVIFDTAQGKLMMTCVVGSLDIASGELTLANASHEVPFMMPAVDKTLGKKDYTFLISDPGPRLGQMLEAVYKETSFKIEDKSALVFYSDGLVDTQNPEGEPFGERALFKLVGKDHSSKKSSQEILEKMRRFILDYKSTAELVDDLSFFVVKYNRSETVVLNADKKDTEKETLSESSSK